MAKVDYIKELISGLKPEERATIDDFLVGKVTADAEKNSAQYDFDLASDYIEDARSLVNSWGKMQGLSSYFPSIDKLTKGFVAGEVIVVGGATSNGKTTLAVNIASRLAANFNRVLFVTLEMTKPQLTSRLMIAHDGFEDMAACLSYQRADEMDWKSVDGLIEKAKRELSVDLVVIDHLHYFTRELQNAAEDLGRITKEFKKNAQRHGLPVILISHTRKGEGNDINDLRGSSYIAQDADIVLMVSRNPEEPEYLKVSCQKNRNRGIDFDDKNNVAMLRFEKTRLIDPLEPSDPWNT